MCSIVPAAASVGSPSKSLPAGLTGSLAKARSGLMAEDKESEEFRTPSATPSGGSTVDGVESAGGADTEEEGQDKLMRGQRTVRGRQ